MSDRQYNEKEIAAIFELATQELEASRTQKLTGAGLSLSELQEIGAESGIPAAYIERAAAVLDGNNVDHVQETLFGISIGTARTINLPRRLTEAEWEELVVELRSTFNAKGKIEDNGSFKQWTNGNLQFMLEPNKEGSRLRMKTTHGLSKNLLGTSPFYFIVGLLVFIAGLTTNDQIVAEIFFGLIMMLMGVGVVGWSKIKLKNWLKTREEQMASIGARLLDRVNAAPAGGKEEVNVVPAISLETEQAPESEAARSTNQKLRN